MSTSGYTQKTSNLKVDFLCLLNYLCSPVQDSFSSSHIGVYGVHQSHQVGLILSQMNPTFGIFVENHSRKCLSGVVLWHFCMAPPKLSFLIRRPNCLWLSSLLKRQSSTPKGNFINTRDKSILGALFIFLTHCHKDLFCSSVNPSL